MDTRPAVGLLQVLQQIPDPRGRKGRRHPLSAMLAVVVCSILSGIRSIDGIADWIHFQPVRFWHRLGFTRTPPVANTFRELLNAIDPDALESVLLSWIEQELSLEIGDVIAIDGKVLCGTISDHHRSIALLAALDQATGCVLAQTQISETTNEHKTALVLLEQLVLENRVITGDAAFCHRDVCEQIVDSQGESLLSVKGNQPNLQRAIEQEFLASDEAFSPRRSTRTPV